MGMFSKLAKTGLAAKIIGEARKPHNQAKVKRLLANVSSRRTNRRAP